MPVGFLQKRKSNAQPNRITVNQKRFGLFFIRTSTENLYKDSPMRLAETLKRYQKSTKTACLAITTWWELISAYWHPIWNMTYSNYSFRGTKINCHPNERRRWCLTWIVVTNPALWHPSSSSKKEATAPHQRRPKGRRCGFNDYTPRFDFVPCFTRHAAQREYSINKLLITKCNAHAACC